LFFHLKKKRAQAEAYAASMPEKSTSQRQLTAASGDAGRRLDLFLAERVPELSRTRIQELIREGNVHVDGRIAKASHRIFAGEVIDVKVLPRPALVAAPEDLPLELLLVDDDFVVVNKPAGMVVHAGAGHARGTLVNALLFRLGALSDSGGALRPGIVHRLDKDTSGAMIVARNDTAHEHLAEQFHSRNVRKIYLALVHGKMPRDSGTITLPVSRDPHRRTRMTARAAKGRHARTDWRVIARLDRCTLVEAALHTGRTHQIRAHFAAIGHPIVGDTLYGAPRSLRAGARDLPLLKRNFLHAARLGFAHPSSGAWVEVRAPLPKELRVYFEQVAASLGRRPAEIDAALGPYLGSS
jgi:23S rRNA pseudouridine1911/1915/1917 synthase